MQTYTISHVSKLLSIPKDTLRYYDKIGLFQPARGENGYRYYTEANLLDLKYVELMKLAGLPLAEIKAILQNRAGRSQANLESTMKILEQQKSDLQRKILLFQGFEELIGQALQVLQNKSCPSDAAEMDQMITRLFSEMRKEP